ncbi:MAG: 4'-phosphopantetheinyl transferase superfamily protein [Chitinophagaceae bacterium]|nr:MAG: 4'-phosphopantetheinyl transferase superfamily protein [Chitinophagaceae bacterium]
MPLVYQQNINAHSRLGVWHIAEDEQFFLERVPLQKEITHPHKRLQHLAGRLLLSELYEDFPIRLIRIADTRKPYLPGEAFHFSISHCGDYAAAIVSTENRVGVDIEIPQEKIERIKNKFLEANEQQLLLALQTTPLKALTIAWSIKESMFKWYAAGKVDFREHLRIVDCMLQDNQFSASCNFQKEQSIAMKVNGIFFNDNCLTWVCT